MRKTAKGAIVIPCYNEEAALPVSAPVIREKLLSLIERGLLSDESRVVFVNDGSRDRTWEIIEELSEAHEHIEGIALSRNQGHQNALLAGLMEERENFDFLISMDADLQDDIDAVDRMIEEYYKGADLVLGVRASRETDSAFKRGSAELFYKLLRKLGAETVHNHADFRLMSRKALSALSEFEEVNLYLRGLIPLLGMRCVKVPYERKERVAGETHYPLGKMIALAKNGITSLSMKPLTLITSIGVFVAILSFVGVLWAVTMTLLGRTVPGWASTTAIICFVSGVQLISLGVIGEYIGKMYMETKRRPRYIVYEKTKDKTKN